VAANLDLSKLNRAIRDAFDATIEAQAEEFDRALSSDIYEWPRETTRNNGDIVSSPRDIVDTGTLIDSLVISRKPDGTTQFSWEVDYAAAVHDGATLKNGTELPARPWTKIGLEECNPRKIMQEHLNKLL
jgi:hypothetical protein